MYEISYSFLNDLAGLTKRQERGSLFSRFIRHTLGPAKTNTLGFCERIRVNHDN